MSDTVDTAEYEARLLCGCKDCAGWRVIGKPGDSIYAPAITCAKGYVIAAKLREFAEASTAALATARAEAAALRKALADLYATAMSDEWRGAFVMAAVHGYQGTPEGRATSGDACENARALLASPEARDAGEGGGCDGNG
jgi:hypothetical protein